MRPILLLLFLLAAASRAWAAEPAAPEVAARLGELIAAAPDKDPFLNGGLIVASDGRIVFQAAAGMADFAASTPLDRDSVFQLASAAKPITSTAILQLRDRGRLRLDDPVARHLPGFPYPAITLRHLLGHTSGLPDLELFEPLVARDPDHVVTASDLIPALAEWRKPPRFPAGDQFRYSNINYQLLALIVERVSGKRFGAYVRDHIFRPAGMRSSYVLGTRAIGRHREPVANHAFAVMYRTVPEDVRRLDYPDKKMMRPYRYEGHNLGSTLGDQNVFSTLGDLLRFDRALAAGRLLSRASQEEAYAPIRLNDGRLYDEPSEYQLYGARCSYGLGWEVCDHPTRGRLVGHAGFNRGIATMLYRGLDRRQLVIMYDNGDTGDFGPKFASVVNLLNGAEPLAVSRKRSLTREYGKALLESGPTAALILYNRLRGDPEHWIGTPAGMNRLGYDLLHNGHSALALEPFGINVLLNPKEANFYDSLGEALAANGRNADAITAYRRSLELNPDNARGKEALRRLEEAPGGAPK
ncbi:MAG TPA: serine hydrolase [Allosphingosinicella sp.]|nr:serine hydrolase [Allosphingosinicella sp.]